jgi:hypothetical protein
MKKIKAGGLSMYAMAAEIRDRIMECASSIVLNEVVSEGMPMEYADMMEIRVYDNLMAEFKNIL